MRRNSQDTSRYGVLNVIRKSQKSVGSKEMCLLREKYVLGKDVIDRLFEEKGLLSRKETIQKGTRYPD